MDKKNILEMKKNRLSKLENSPKNVKSGGVVRKLKREIRNLEKLT